MTNGPSNQFSSDVGTSSSSFGFGKGLRKRKPSYQISEESEEDSQSHDAGSYEVNYKTTVTHKPGPSFDTGSFKFSSVTSAPLSKTKFGLSGGGGSKFTSYNSQHTGSSPASSAPSGIFKFNEPAASSLGGGGGHSNGAITTKFAISHPVPTHSASNLGGSYQSFSDESFGGTSEQQNEQFIADYHTSLAKYQKKEKTEKPKFQLNSPFKTKFSDTTNFKVSSDFKVGSDSHQPSFSHTKTKFGGEFGSFKPNFKLQEVPNLYPSEDQFRPSLGFASNEGNGNKLFEPNSENEDYVQQQLANNPASRGQYQQYLKSQEDEKIEQQALLEQLKYQHTKPKPVPAPLPKPSFIRPQATYSGASTKFRPYITVKKNFNRRKPLVRLSSAPGLSHYRTPAIDGPYTIHFSV